MERRLFRFRQEVFNGCPYYNSNALVIISNGSKPGAFSATPPDVRLSNSMNHCQGKPQQRSNSPCYSVQILIVSQVL
ncbi:hypothetical protein TNCV_3848571 [Trichonephila clavipes]|uniref:Uncharacterized protein n=1 Tax=Trichonephila clavipes TaxID=2585209 RepID=A0A8X6RIZ5_TRICX|nr:hypothetical protein TNCV_3848571 [Trichonephila clavipes]